MNREGGNREGVETICGSGALAAMGIIVGAGLPAIHKTGNAALTLIAGKPAPTKAIEAALQERTPPT